MNMAEPSPELVALVIAARQVCEQGPIYIEQLRSAGRAFYNTVPIEAQRRFNGCAPMPWSPPVLERCHFCGGMFENPCDTVPPDTCEQAMNKFYGDLLS